MCTFNLRKIAEGLARYHEIHGVYPMGAMHAGDPEDPRVGPSYVGIAGGCDIDPDSADYDLCPARPQTPDVYINENKGTGPNHSRSTEMMAFLHFPCKILLSALCYL